MQPTSNTGSNRFQIPITSQPGSTKTLNYSTRRVDIRTRAEPNTQSISPLNEKVIVEVAQPVRRVITNVSRSPTRTIVARTVTPEMAFRPVSPIRDHSPSFESYTSPIRYTVDQSTRNSRSIISIDDNREKDRRESQSGQSIDYIRRLERENIEVKRLYLTLKDSNSYNEINKRLIEQVEELTREIVGLQELNHRLKNLADDELVVVEKIQTKEVFGKKRRMYENGSQQQDSQTELDVLKRGNNMLLSQIHSKADNTQLNGTIENLRADIERKKSEYWNKHQELNESKAKISSFELKIQELEKNLRDKDAKICDMLNKPDISDQLKSTLANKESEIAQLKANEQHLSNAFENIHKNSIELNEYYDLKRIYTETVEHNNQLKTDLLHKEQNVKDYISVINELNKEITTLKYSSVHDYEIRQSVDHLESDINSKNIQLKEAANKIIVLEDDNKSKDNTIEDLRFTIKEQDPFIYITQLAELKAYINEHDPDKYISEINYLKKQIEDKSPDMYIKEIEDLRIMVQTYENDIATQREMIANAQANAQSHKTRADSSERAIENLRSTIELLKAEHKHKENDLRAQLNELEHELNIINTELQNHKNTLKTKEDEIELLTNEIQFIEKYGHPMSAQGSKRQVELETAYQRILNYEGRDLASQGSKLDLLQRQSLRESQLKLFDLKLASKNTEDLQDENIEIEWNDLLLNNEGLTQRLSKHIKSQEQLTKLTDKLANINRSKNPISLSLQDYCILSKPHVNKINLIHFDKSEHLENLLAEKSDIIAELNTKISELDGYITGLEQDNQIILDQNKSQSIEISQLRKDIANLESLLNEYNATINKLKSRELELENEKKTIYSNIKSIIESIPIEYEAKLSMLHEIRNDNALILLDRAIKLLERTTTTAIQMEIPDLVLPTIQHKKSRSLKNEDEIKDLSMSSQRSKEVVAKIDKSCQINMLEASNESQYDEDTSYRNKYMELFDMNHQLSDKIVTLYDQINKLETHLKSYKDKNNKLSQTISKNNIQIDALKNENESMHMKLAQRGDIEESYRELDESNQRLQREYDHLKEQYAQLLNRVTQKRSHILNELNNFAQAKNDFNNSFFSELSKATSKADK